MRIAKVCFAYCTYWTFAMCKMEQLILRTTLLCACAETLALGQVIWGLQSAQYLSALRLFALNIAMRKIQLTKRTSRPAFSQMF